MSDSIDNLIPDSDSAAPLIPVDKRFETELYFRGDELNDLNAAPEHVLRGRAIDVRDSRLAHPEVAGMWFIPPLAASNAMYMPEMPVEQKLASSDGIREATVSGRDPEYVEKYACDTEIFQVSGCPEESDAPLVEVRVMRPKTVTNRKARVLFYISGGGIANVVPETFTPERNGYDHDAVVVTAIYRRSYEATYPGALNDLHAAYQWMLDNADELGIDADNVVILGMSSGAHLGLALAFRLKRYGITPKGVAAVEPQVDDRPSKHPVVFAAGACDCVQNHAMSRQYMGYDFASDAIGPEAYANHATVGDCVGLAPVSLYYNEFDPERHSILEFTSKLHDANTYVTLHTWGGAGHVAMEIYHGTFVEAPDNSLSVRFKTVLDGDIEDFFTTDLRRPWMIDRLKEQGPWW